MVSDVASFFNGKTIFMTGGSGFVGICLIEKLLRSCPDLKNIYVLLRPKKGKQIEERLEELKTNSVFNKMKEENKSDLLKKLIPVAGDVGEDNLGLSPADKLTLIDTVQVVFHSAASLDFEADLKIAANINLLGTRRVAKLCQKIKNLKAMVHVSSAYVSAYMIEVEERIYPAPCDVENLLTLVNKLDGAALNIEGEKLMNNHPNFYTFTKHLAEHEIKHASIPAAIVRPSMITGAWKEPLPGWTVSKNGPHGFLMGASKGVIRRLPIEKNLISDYIPVDIVVNCLITAAYVVNRDGATEPKVFHCTSSTTNPFKWLQVESKLNSYLHRFPLRNAVWYPYLKMMPSIFMFRLSAFFVHFIPGYILDGITKLAGGRPILIKLHTNVNNSLDRLRPFIFTEWKFHSPRLTELHKSLSEDDKQIFDLDIKPLDWEEYFVNLTQGVRTYLSNESPKTLQKARSKDKMLKYAHIGLQATLLGLIGWLVKSLFATTWATTGLVVLLTYFIFDQL
ncbi:PREDICTED: putative fatty acyl-CoA reductase CG8306 [Dufourea novaeangliae]|uniref:putative fatty acyl-CoA reductase CG8306 n=1 Tax=Dufourea novaeangliae TaxID=178035 RepID=UPI000766F5B9|nr:PREDICTED: putative fatty acyl-CoA reductase CG8306 [Dufourea novaeangliae]